MCCPLIQVVLENGEKQNWNSLNGNHQRSLAFYTNRLLLKLARSVCSFSAIQRWKLCRRTPFRSWHPQFRSQELGESVRQEMLLPAASRVWRTGAGWCGFNSFKWLADWLHDDTKGTNTKGTNLLSDRLVTSIHWALMVNKRHYTVWLSLPQVCSCFLARPLNKQFHLCVLQSSKDACAQKRLRTSPCTILHLVPPCRTWASVNRRCEKLWLSVCGMSTEPSIFSFHGGLWHSLHFPKVTFEVGSCRVCFKNF